MTSFILLALGLLLILLEFYLPGAIMGISGCVLVVVSIVLFAYQAGSILPVALYVIGAIVAVILVIRLALWLIPRSKLSFNIYSSSDQRGYQASSYDALAIGKKGIVLTDLKPGGHILVDGKKQQAISQSGYLVKGSEVLVVGGQEESLIVKHIKKDASS